MVIFVPEQDMATTVKYTKDKTEDQIRAFKSFDRTQQVMNASAKR